MALAVPPGVTPNYYDSPPSSAWQSSVANSVGLAIVTIVVFARCYTKFFIVKAPGWEDYFCILAFAFFVAFAASDFIQRFHYGGGRHSWDLPPEYYNGNLITSAVYGYLYIVGLTLAKLSLLFFLYRIFNVDLGFRIAAWAIGAVLVIWTTVSILLCIFACKPIKASWDIILYVAPTTVCRIKAYDVTNIHGYCNIITDFALLVLPIPLVWHLQAPIRKKIGIATVFAAGIFICAVSIFRQYILYNTDKAGDPYYQTRNKVWISIEFAFSILVACMPVLTPLFRRLSALSWLPSLRSMLTRSNRPNRPNANEIEIFGPLQGQDVERDALRRNQDHFSSWQTPRAWREWGRQRSWGDDGSTTKSQSDVTLQDIPPTSAGRKD